MSTTTAPTAAAPAAVKSPAKRPSKLRAVAPDATPKPEKLKALVYGLSNHGKSFLASASPRVYYIDPEGGARLPAYQERIRAGGGAYLGREQGAGDPEVVLEQFRELASAEHEFATVAIDSVTKLFLDLQADEAERLGDKDQFGASKKPAVKVMRRIAAWIQRLPLNVLLLAHGKPEYKDGQQTGLAPDCWEKLIYELDLVLRAEKRGNSYVAVVTKSRFAQLPVGTTIPLTFDDLANALGREGVFAIGERVQLATKEQVAELHRLLAATGTGDDESAKWLAKAKVADWADMDADTAAKVLAYLADRESKGALKLN